MAVLKADRTNEQKAKDPRELLTTILLRETPVQATDQDRKGDRSRQSASNLGGMRLRTYLTQTTEAWRASLNRPPQLLKVSDAIYPISLRRRRDSSGRFKKFGDRREVVCGRATRGQVHTVGNTWSAGGGQRTELKGQPW